MRRFKSWAIAARIAPWLLTVASNPSAGQSSLPEPGSTATPAVYQGQIVALKLRELAARARLDELADERRQLEPRQVDAPAEPLSASTWLFDQVVSDDLIRTGEEALTAIDRRLGDVNADAEAAAQACELALRQWLGFLAKQQAIERELAASNRDASSLSRLGWLGAMLVVGGLLLTAHERRDRVRWAIRALASRPGRVGGAAALAVILVGATVPAREDVDWIALRDALEQKVQVVEARAVQEEKEVDALLARHREARVVFALVPTTDDLHEKARMLVELEHKLQLRYRQLLMMTRRTALLDRETEKLDLKRLEESRNLAERVDRERVRRLSNSGLKLATCGLLATAVVAPLALVRGRRRRFLAAQARKCPRCLVTDSLEFVTASEAADPPGPQNRLVECSICKYEIRERDLAQNRLCFPTVGIRASGKTHWMVILYDLIKNANVPVAAEVQKIPSREDARFGLLVRQLLYERGRPSPNVLNLPYPLTFHVYDADPLGRTSTMVNVFDFAGELRELIIDLDPFRKRALNCEGFAFFLDPTQVTPGSGMDLEDQIQTLEGFVADLRAMRKIPTERPVNVPVAVCLTKLDLLIEQNPIGARADSFVAELRRSLGQAPKLEIIHQRSQLCARVLPLLFPGWNVDAALRRSFGGRYMLFPISSVGLEATEQGCDDLETRTFAPFGVLEPLIWLLHMHGFKVFG